MKDVGDDEDGGAGQVAATGSGGELSEELRLAQIAKTSGVVAQTEVKLQVPEPDASFGPDMTLIYMSSAQFLAIFVLLLLSRGFLQTTFGG